MSAAARAAGHSGPGVGPPVHPTPRDRRLPGSAAIHLSPPIGASRVATYVSPITPVSLDGSLWVADDNTNTITKYDTTGSAIRSFASPSTNRGDLGIDSNGYLWFAGYDSIYQVGAFGEVGAVLSAPGASARGMGVDPNDCLWITDDGTNSVYQLDQAGSVITSFAAPSSNPVGLTVTSDGCLWIVDNGATSIFKLNTSGSTLASYHTPYNGPLGLGRDANNSFWLGDQANSLFNQTSTDLGAYFDTPGSAVAGLGVDSNRCLWVADADLVSLYQYTQDGSQVAAIGAAGNQANGVDVDRTSGCLWQADNNQSIVYELDTAGPAQSSFGVGFNVVGLGIDSSSCLWVGAASGSIYKYDQAGSALASFNGPLNRADGIGVDQNDCLWVGNKNQNTVAQVTQTGSGVSSFNTSGPFGFIAGVGVDPSTYSLWLTNRDNDMVKRYSQAGDGPWQSKINAPGFPAGVAVAHA